MARARIESSFFVFVIAIHEDRVLLIRERKHGQLWYAPAGGLEPGETIREAAIRETMEEAGIRVEPTTLINIEQQWYPRTADADTHEARPGIASMSSWWRFILLARPLGNLTPKSKPDQHSLEARWVHPDEIKALPLRHPEVIDLVALALSLGDASRTHETPCCNHPRGHEPHASLALRSGSRVTPLTETLGPPPITNW
jgi:8-oxo-dGTP pyrophosphatase MutT (NUDIX family)